MGLGSIEAQHSKAILYVRPVVALIIRDSHSGLASLMSQKHQACPGELTLKWVRWVRYDVRIRTGVLMQERLPFWHSACSRLHSILGRSHVAERPGCNSPGDRVSACWSCTEYKRYLQPFE